MCVMQLEAGLDTGPVYATQRTSDRRARDRRRACAAGSSTSARDLLVEQLPAIAAAHAPVPQVGEPTYAEKLTVDEFRLDPARPAIELDRLVRAGNPRPGAWFRIGGRRVKVWRAHPERAGVDAPRRARASITPAAALVTAAGVLVLEEVQPEGKRPDAGAGVARRRAFRRASRPGVNADAIGPPNSACRSRSRRSSASTTARTRTSCLPELLRQARVGAPRPCVRDRARLRNGAHAARARLPPGRVSSRQIDTLDPDVRAALRLGAFQLVTGVSPHAAVGETVGVVQERAAVSRTACCVRSPAPGRRGRCRPGDDVRVDRHPNVASRLDRASSFVEELGRDDALATLALDNEPPVVTLRVNPMRTTPTP